ncbi:MAG: type III PLP-dependent enzyme [Pseudomonadota bacterium]
MEKASTVAELVGRYPPVEPTFLFRPHLLKAAAETFVNRFPATPFYAVKANPAPHILQGLWQAGVRRFDTASIGEVRAVRAVLPEAELAFLHPVKPEPAIAEAYHVHGVRAFVLDCAGELAKILRATGNAQDLTLLVRVHVSNEGAAKPLAGKFGASAIEAPGLLQAARAHAQRLGVSFHVGSQALNPDAWRRAMADLSALITTAGTIVDIVNVGGGFAVPYGVSGMEAPPPMDTYAAAISSAFEDMVVRENAELWCEPGRALVAEAESLLCRVDGVKPGAVYLNDGSFGALYDVVHEGWAFPYRCFDAAGQELAGPMAAVTVYGPTCDSADRFPEPLLLPETLEAGSYVEFGTIGAYGRSLATRFNGFGSYCTCEVLDAPWVSAFAENVTNPSKSGTVG